MEKKYSFFEILKKTGKFTLGIIIALIISKFILHNIFGVKTSREIISEQQKQYHEPLKVEPNIEQMLLIVADSINKSCPLSIDSITDLKNVTLPNSKAFQYNLALQLDAKKYNLNKLKKIIDKEIISEFISTPVFKMLRDSNVTVIYHFIDKNGRLMFKSVFNEKQ